MTRLRAEPFLVRFRSRLSDRIWRLPYVFAYLVALALRARLRELGDECGPKYVDFLETGGSAGTLEQLTALGIDVTGADGFEPAFAELRRMLEAF